jgi:hypothetical protein
MNNNWEKRRRVEFLKYRKNVHLKLLDQKKIGLNAELESKVNSCSIILGNQLHWEIKSKYLNLLKKFVTKKMKAIDFMVAFQKRYDSIYDVVPFLESNRIVLSFHEKSEDFGQLLAEISSCCWGYSGEDERQLSEYDIGDTEFTNIMEEIYFQFNELISEEL